MSNQNNELNLIKMIDFGIKAYAQEDGEKVGALVTENYKKNSQLTVLDFDGVSSANTAFFNAFISKLINHFGEKESYSQYFKITNANNSILSIFSLTMQYAKFFDFKNEKLDA